MARLTIGALEFPTKAAAAACCRRILASGPGRIRGSEERFLRDLLTRHPEAKRKIGAGIDSLAVAPAPDRKGCCFWIHRVDGTRTDFSYRSCLTPPRSRDDARAAFRDEVIDQILEFRAAFFDATPASRCPLTGDRVTREDHHVDHVVPFRDLLERFLAERELILDQVVVRQGQDGTSRAALRDRSLADDWKAYHQAHAVLRVTTPFGNLSRGKVPGVSLRRGSK